MAIEILYFEFDDEKSPYLEWESELDMRTRGVVWARLNRIRLGNFGDCKSLGGGLYELRLDVGPGYRVYYGKMKDVLVVLLNGGDKGSQQRDIKRAKEYWNMYRDSLKKR